MTPTWWLTKDGDVDCLALYERHYSAYPYADKRVRKLFCGPGEKVRRRRRGTATITRALRATHPQWSKRRTATVTNRTGANAASMTAGRISEGDEMTTFAGLPRCHHPKGSGECGRLTPCVEHPEVPEMKEPSQQGLTCIRRVHYFGDPSEEQQCGMPSNARVHKLADDTGGHPFETRSAAPAPPYLHDNPPPSVRDRMQQYADESTQLAMLLGRIRRALGITVDPLKKYTLEQVEEEIMSKIGEMTTGGQTVETPRCWKSHDWKSDAAGVFRCTRCGVLVSACQPAVETSWNVHSKCRC